MGARESLEGCFEVLQPQLADIGATWQDFLWAVQVWDRDTSSSMLHRHLTACTRQHAMRALRSVVSAFTRATAGRVSASKEKKT